MLKRILMTGAILLASFSFARPLVADESVQIRQGTIPTVTRVDPNQQMHPDFGIPSPELATNSRNYVDRTHSTVAVVVLIGVSLVPIGYALRRSLKEQKLLPIVVALSGSMGVFAEVYTDVLGAVHWSHDPGHITTRTVFHLFGRDMALVPVVAWIAFGAVLTYLCFEIISRQPKTKWLWAAFLLACLADMAFEEPMLNYGGLYTYYGNQPLILLSKFPWWWMPMNAGGLFLAAALAYRYRDSLRGFRSFAMFWITPAAFMAFYGFCAWPTLCAINGNYSWLTIQLAGLLGVGVATLSTAGVIHLVLRRDPFDLNSTETKE